MDSFRSGFVAVVGPTNSGKSTLVNALVGEKVSIISPRPQTTYHGIRGIFSGTNAQIVFTDTPGLQNYRAGVAKLLNRVSERHMSEADLCLWVFDCSEEGFQKKFERLRKKITEYSPQAKAILCLNKVDKIAKPALLPLIQALYDSHLFACVIPISARKRDGVDRVLAELMSRLPAGERLFPQEMKSDRDEKFVVTEWIREQAYHRLYEEIPYSMWVEMESWEESPGKIVAHATIHVDGRSKKGIVIGKGGKKLKEIGMAARLALEKKLCKKLSLFLNVHLDPDWQSDRNRVHRYLEL